LVATARSGSMRMHFYMACVNDEPFKIGIIYQCFQDPLPNSFISPSTKASVCILPVSIIWRQIPPWRTSAQYPKHRVDELAVVARISAPCPFAA
jgi:hypothetical protein